LAAAGRRLTPGIRALTFGAALALSAMTSPSDAAVSVRAGFVVKTAVDGLNQPTAMAFAPDGRLFIAEQGGTLRIAKLDQGTWSLLQTPFLQLAVDAGGERGLLGVALHPDFANSGKVYVYHTVAGSPAHNRVSEFTANGDVAMGGSGTPTEVVGFDIDDLTSATNHNGGALHFGIDGKLYVAVGDNATGLAAGDPATSPPQELDNLLGKILRLNDDLTIPADNPFVPSLALGRNGAIWALGLRNPFTFSIQADTGRMFLDDVGQNTYEEVDDGLSGANYGWPVVEGPKPPDELGMTYPLYFYTHSVISAGTPTACAVTGGSFPPDSPSFGGDYFFADLCGGWIRRLHLGPPVVADDFAKGIVSPVDLAAGPDGRLYFLARGNNGPASGFVGEITQNNKPPVPRIATPAAGLLFSGGRAIQYSGTGADPEDGSLKGQQLSWEVTRHDGASTQTVATSSGTSGSFVVDPNGPTSPDAFFRISLSVTDSLGANAATYRDIFPKKVQVTVKTDPPGLGFLLDGQPFTSTTSFTGVTGILRSLSAVAPQSFHHAIYDFWSWSDGGAPGHSVKTPAVNTTYVVSYRKRKTGPRSTP
jgi:glucose/arabinose dehydrogenase